MWIQPYRQTDSGSRLYYWVCRHIHNLWIACVQDNSLLHSWFFCPSVHSAGYRQYTLRNVHVPRYPVFSDHNCLADMPQNLPSIGGWRSISSERLLGYAVLRDADQRHLQALYLNGISISWVLHVFQGILHGFQSPEFFVPASEILSQWLGLPFLYGLSHHWHDAALYFYVHVSLSDIEDKMCPWLWIHDHCLCFGVSYLP